MRISSIAPFVSAAALPAFAQGKVRSGMNAFATYTVKHIQKGLTLLPKIFIAHMIAWFVGCSCSNYSPTKDDEEVLSENNLNKNSPQTKQSCEQ